MPPYKRKLVPYASSQVQRKRARSLQTSGRLSLAGRRKMVSAKGESNYVDVSNAAYANDTTGSITLLNTVPQGNTVNTRVGKKFQMTSLQVRGRMQSGATTTITDAACLVVYDRRPTGALPAITDILNSVSAASFNKDDNSGRFQIVRRWDNVLIGNNATPSTGCEAYNMDEYIKLNKLTVNKSAGTGVIADIEQGALYFVTVGDAAAGTTAGITAVGFRLRFQDI